MEELQVSTVEQARIELKEFTSLFVNWGNALYDGEMEDVELSAYELGTRTYNNMEVIGRVSHDKAETIHDKFSLYEYAKKVMEK